MRNLRESAERRKFGGEKEFVQFCENNTCTDGERRAENAPHPRVGSDEQAGERGRAKVEQRFGQFDAPKEHGGREMGRGYHLIAVGPVRESVWMTSWGLVARPAEVQKWGVRYTAFKMSGSSSQIFLNFRNSVPGVSSSNP